MLEKNNCSLKLLKDQLPEVTLEHWSNGFSVVTCDDV